MDVDREDLRSQLQEKHFEVDDHKSKHGET